MSRGWAAAEIAAVGISSLMVVVSIARPAWIELVFRVDPDHQSGLFEILLVGGLTGVGATTSLAARAQRHRAGPPAKSRSRDYG
jgi:hypothetical protein